jgi:hypothetical protein
MFLNAKMLLPPCVPEQEVQGCMLLVNNAERIVDETHLDLQLLPNLQSLFPAGHTALEDGLKDLGHLSCCRRSSVEFSLCVHLGITAKWLSCCNIQW